MRLITCMITLLISCSVLADVVVIVHPSNSNVGDSEMAKRIFEGRIKAFKNGDAVIPINQLPDSAVTEQFNSVVLKKNAKQLKAYWAKIVFTGKGTPPKEVENDSEVIKLVATNPNTIGYVDSGSVDDSVKVFASF